MIKTAGFAPRPVVQAHSRLRLSTVARSAAPQVGSPTTSVDTDPVVASLSFDSFDVERESLSAEVAVASVDLVSPPKPSIADSAVVQWYLRNLEAHPLQTKCWTSFSGFLIGDITAQVLTEPSFALSRALILALYGFFIDAPAGNAFYVRIFLQFVDDCVDHQPFSSVDRTRFPRCRRHHRLDVSRHQGSRTAALRASQLARPCRTLLTRMMQASRDPAIIT